MGKLSKELLRVIMYYFYAAIYFKMESIPFSGVPIL